jgi:HK97 family phage major capsid protein
MIAEASRPGMKSAGLLDEINNGNKELGALVDTIESLEREVATERLQNEAMKASRRPVDRQIFPDGGALDDPLGRYRASGDSWGAAVVREASVGMSGTKSLATTGTAFIPIPILGPIEDPRRAHFVAELLRRENAPGGHFSYLKQTVRTNNAAVVAEGTKKPTSVYTLEKVDDTTKVIAHLSEPISRQVFDDAALVSQFVDNELRYGLNLALDARIVSEILGAGIPVEGALGNDLLFATRRGKTRLQEKEVTPSAYVMNPRDWEEAERQAVDQFVANPNLAAPVDAMREALWGIPVVVSNAIAEGTVLLGNFAGSALLFQTDGVRVDWSEGTYDSGSGATDWERNLIRARAEGRWEVAVTQSFAFIEIMAPGTGS